MYGHWNCATGNKLSYHHLIHNFTFILQYLAYLHEIPTVKQLIFKNQKHDFVTTVIFFQIKNAYLRQVHKRKKSLAANQLKNCFVDGSDESRRMAKKLLDSYTSDAALALDSGGAKCAKCGDKANKKCSRCKSEWYCGRWLIFVI